MNTLYLLINNNLNTIYALKLLFNLRVNVDFILLIKNGLDLFFYNIINISVSLIGIVRLKWIPMIEVTRWAYEYFNC